MDIPLDNLDMEIFTDGSSFVRDGKRKAGYAVVTGKGQFSFQSQRKATPGKEKESEVTQSCPTLCDPMDCNTSGFPVHHQLLKLAQTHVHQVSDAVQPSHPLSSPSPPALNHSQHKGFFQ